MQKLYRERECRVPYAAHQNLICNIQLFESFKKTATTLQLKPLYCLDFPPATTIDKEDGIHKKKRGCYLNFDRYFKSNFSFQKEHTYIINISSVFNEDFFGVTCTFNTATIYLYNAHHLPRQTLQSQGKYLKVFVQYFQSCIVQCKATMVYHYNLKTRKFSMKYFLLQLL